MQKSIDVTIALRSWIALGATIGFCWGVVFGIASAAYSLVVKHSAVEAAQDLVGGILAFPLGLAAISLIGYPVYRYLLTRSARYRSLYVDLEDRAAQ